MRSIDNTPLQDTGMDCSKVSGLNSNREYSILHIKTPAESHFRYCRGWTPLFQPFANVRNKIK